MRRLDLPSLIRQERQELRRYGVRAVFEDALVRLSMRAVASGYRARATPRLKDLNGVARSVHTSAHNAVQEWIFNGDEPAFQETYNEFLSLSAELDRRVEERRLPYPDTYAMQRDAALVVYCMVRRQRPEYMLETGVANGVSTFFALRGMMLNGRGALHSVDVKRDVGIVLDDGEKRAWTLHCLNTKHLRQDFVSLAGRLPPVDLYLHDSDHTYRWQSFEYRTVLGAMRGGGTIMTDDADSSYAFLDLCRQLREHPCFLVGQRKVLGVVTLHGPQPGPPA